MIQHSFTHSDRKTNQLICILLRSRLGPIHGPPKLGPIQSRNSWKISVHAQFGPVFISLSCPSPKNVGPSLSQVMQTKTKKLLFCIIWLLSKVRIYISLNYLIQETNLMNINKRNWRTSNDRWKHRNSDGRHHSQLLRHNHRNCQRSTYKR